VPGARGKNIFAAPPTKATEFEVENRHENAEKTKPKLLCVLLLLFEVIKFV